MNYKLLPAAILSCGLITLLTACGDSASNNGLTFQNNIETSFAFSDNPRSNIIYFKNAHSGRYVCIIDSTNIFSVGFNMKVKDIDPDPLKKVTIGAWFNAQQAGSNAQLAIDIRDKNGNTVDWIAQPTGEYLTSTGDWNWVEMSIDLTVKNFNNPDNIYRIYAFNRTGSSVLVDDIKISFEK
jgi:hypothetical protein